MESQHYNGTVTLQFDPQKHYYLIDGELAFGVTNVLQILAKPALLPWVAKCTAEFWEQNIKPGEPLDEVQIQRLVRESKVAHRNRKDAAADMGTYVHDWIEKYVTGDQPTPPQNAQLAKAVRAFVKWYESTSIEPLASEQKLCSPTLKLAGTVDFIGKIDGKLTIVDWKTGSGIYPEMFLQMGAYVLMYEEEFGEKVEQVGVVNCSVKAPFKTQFTTDVAKLKRMYKQVLTLAKELRQLEEELK